jgi:hypothetical protein
MAERRKKISQASNDEQMPDQTSAAWQQTAKESVDTTNALPTSGGVRRQPI